MTLLTPLGLLAALAAVVPLAAALAARRRTDDVRRGLGLRAPGGPRSVLRPALAVVAVALLGLAAAQPALTRESSPRVRRDVQAVFVLDTSRSMAAARSPSAPTRLDRAIAAAIRLRAAIPEVESGVLTLTDRVLPDLLPVADRRGFDAVVQRAVRIESPPPRSASVRATQLSALDQIDVGNVFGPAAKRRLIVVLTDGESAAVDGAELSRALPAARGYRFAAVRFWNGAESVYDADGEVEAAYRPDATGAVTLRDTATALGGRSFEEQSLGQAASYLRQLAGTGPTVQAAATSRDRLPLGPWIALAALAAAVAALSAVPPRLRWRA